MATILVVDDNPINVKLLQRALTSAGFTVRTAHDAAAARALIVGCDLVLMDILMPDTDGLELTRELHRDPETARIPVIAVTGYSDDYHEREALAAGCVGYLTQPVDTKTLPALIHETIARTRSTTGRRKTDIRDAWTAERKRIKREVWKRHATTALKVLAAVAAALGALVTAVRAWWK